MEGGGSRFNGVHVGAVDARRFGSRPVRAFSSDRGRASRSIRVRSAAAADAFVWLLRQPHNFSGRLLSLQDLINLGVLHPARKLGSNNGLPTAGAFWGVKA